MRFYDRANELEALQKVHAQLQSSSRLSVITGRRRIGKTRLIRQFCLDRDNLYFFISRKSEEILCEEFIGYIRESFQRRIPGRITRLIDLFHLLFDWTETRELTVVVDEFQELAQVSPAFLAEFQNLWDSRKENSHLHLIVSGSVYSMMHRIFLDHGQPLYGRADLVINLKAFPIATLAEILTEDQAYSADNLLSCYILSGAIPRYLEILRDNHALTRDRAVDLIFSDYSVFAEEGKNLLIEEFGRDHAVYFSILELIAAGKTSRVEIESVLESGVGGHLARLENDYSLITQYRPFNAKPGSRSVKYKLNEPFLAFWFAYFHRYRSAIESSNTAYLKQRFTEQYPQLAGYWLERLFADICLQSGNFNRVGSYWEKGFTNQIDLVAINSAAKLLVLAEIKLQKKNLRRERLIRKAENIRKQFPDHRIEYRCLSLSDLEGSYTGLRDW
ncbi:MAG: ATP-binding protein [Candidatus Cloacimonetes bacterium]|nr:ATP-binding protein [Candidatus Cloacimonadota bacterium]